MMQTGESRMALYYYGSPIESSRLFPILTFALAFGRLLLLGLPRLLRCGLASTFGLGLAGFLRLLLGSACGIFARTPIPVAGSRGKKIC